jgi:hypothetical protein
LPQITPKILDIVEIKQMKSYHRILLILLIANIAFVNSKRELKILSKEELKITESRTEKSRHDTIEDVFDDQIFLF